MTTPEELEDFRRRRAAASLAMEVEQAMSTKWFNRATALRNAINGHRVFIPGRPKADRLDGYAMDGDRIARAVAEDEAESRLPQASLPDQLAEAEREVNRAEGRIAEARAERDRLERMIKAGEMDVKRSRVLASHGIDPDWQAKGKPRGNYKVGAASKAARERRFITSMIVILPDGRVANSGVRLAESHFGDGPERDRRIDWLTGTAAIVEIPAGSGEEVVA